jgi:hypothetical protein
MKKRLSLPRLRIRLPFGRKMPTGLPVAGIGESWLEIVGLRIFAKMVKVLPEVNP